jgi:O-antigen/teichoic acid export membrane protein
MKLLPDSRKFMGSLGLLLLLNLVIKPVWVLGIDRQVQNITGYEVYGQYFGLFSLALVFQFLMDLGITAFVNRSIAVDSSKGPALLSQAISMKFVLSLLYILVVLTIAWFTNAYTAPLLWLLILLQVLSGFQMVLRAYLSSSQLFVQDAWVSVTDKLFVIIVIGAILWLPGTGAAISINRFVLIQISGLVLSMALAIFFLFQRQVQWNIRPWKYFSWGILRESLPFAVNIFFMTVLMRADGFLIERMAPGGAYDAGTYAAAFRLNDAVNMVGYIMAGFLLPYIARQWPQEKQVKDVIDICRPLLMIPSVLLAVAAPFISGWINTVLYHGREAGTSALIKILFLCLPAYVIIQIHGTLLTATGYIRDFLKLSFLFALILVIADLFIIPRYGINGAAWVSVWIQTGYAATVLVVSGLRTRIWPGRKEVFMYFGIAVAAFLVFKYLFL